MTTEDEIQLFYAACLLGASMLIVCWYAWSNKP